MERFDGKTIVVCGASRGIGAAIAKRFAKEGGSLNVNSNEDAVHDIAEEVRTQGENAHSVIVT